MDSRSPRERTTPNAYFGGSPAGGVDPTEFAEYLRTERERRRITLDQVADQTKIAPRHLAALERGDVRAWPGGMYRRAMMRAYAESIGLDREAALEQFDRAFAQPRPQPEVAPQQHASVAAPVAAPRRLTRRAALGLAASAVFLLVAVAGWRATRGEARESSPALVVKTPEAVRVEQRQPTPATATLPTPAALRTAPAIAPAQERPLASEGHIVVESDPRGARVTINGIGWGETPLTVRHLPFGDKRVRLTKDGYVSVERTVRLAPDRSGASVRVTLPAR